NTPPSYFTLTVAGAGGGAGMLDEESFAWVVDRGRCAMTLNAIAPTSTMAIAKRFGLRMGSSNLTEIDFMFRREARFIFLPNSISGALGIAVNRQTCNVSISTYHP